MALYEYFCKKCEVSFEIRIPMAEVTQFSPCPNCDERASKVIGNFTFVGRVEAGSGDGPAPWEDESASNSANTGSADLPNLDGHPHGHSHGPGGHTH